MQKFLIVLLLILASFFTNTYAGDKAAFGIRFSGYVKTDVLYDSRQTISVRRGHFLLYPAPEVLDVNGNDIAAVPHFNMLAIQTRLRGTITAPDAFGAKISGVIEGAFFGHLNSELNEFRLRHAFLKMDWEKSSLLIGQYWHPMFVVEVFPGTISFNTGVPFQAFSRNPQIRYTRRFADFSVSATALTQADFVSAGPIGPNCIYLRNSGIPVLDLTLKYKTKSFVAGAGANYKTLLPRLSNTDGTDLYQADKTISSMAATAFAKVVINDLVLKAEGTYGENLTDMLMLGGYAVSDTSGMGFASEYTNIKTASMWGEIVYGQALQVGLFAGYTKNLGAEKDIVGAYYSRGKNIENVVRISPRAQYTIEKTRFALEMEYTSAAYGTPDSKGVVKDTTSVANLRLLFGAYLFF